MPKLFLSYSSHDKAFVDKLATDLTACDIGVWVDKREIQVGDNIVARIQDGLSESDYLGVVLSKHSAQSEWVKAEMSAAFLREMESRRVVVLPLLLAGGWHG